jgi:hypothetical protein
MPISKYYGGHGEEVMSDMKKRYGGKKGKSVFYATANKRGQTAEHGSLEDITALEDASECDVVDGGNAHPIHAGYKGKGGLDNKGAIVWGETYGWTPDGVEMKGSEHSANRDLGYGIHLGAPVDYFGPDTDYRAEEIDTHQYGADYDPSPLRDYYKSEDHMHDRTFRVEEQDEYDSSPQPGMVTDKQPMSEAYGAVNHRGAGPDREKMDHRSFESQREFARTNKKRSTEYMVDVSGLDTKKGDKIR